MQIEKALAGFRIYSGLPEPSILDNIIVPKSYVLAQLNVGLLVLCKNKDNGLPQIY